MAKRTPTKNIHWKSITPQMCVRDTGRLFVVSGGGRKSAVAFWEGREAIEAQRWLKARSKKACRR